MIEIRILLLSLLRWNLRNHFLQVPIPAAIAEESPLLDQLENGLVTVVVVIGFCTHFHFDLIGKQVIGEELQSFAGEEVDLNTYCFQDDGMDVRLTTVKKEHIILPEVFKIFGSVQDAFPNQVGEYIQFLFCYMRLLLFQLVPFVFVDGLRGKEIGEFRMKFFELLFGEAGVFQGVRN